MIHPTLTVSYLPSHPLLEASPRFSLGSPGLPIKLIYLSGPDELTGKEKVILLQAHQRENLLSMKKIKARAPEAKLIILDPKGKAPEASTYMRQGAFFCINHLEELSKLVSLLGLPKLENGCPGFYQNPFVGSSAAMTKVKGTLLLLSSQKGPVLITGESGTGKELAAHFIHDQSPRKNQNFVPVNCGAIPENLVESEFFGSTKGAFTDARSQVGFFEWSHKGTLFLDEVAELPSHSQTKLLRALEEGKINRVGERTSRFINTRLVCATNKDLKQELEEKRLREDFYYRISVYRLTLPPLRERKEDILTLARFYFEKDQNPLPIISPQGAQKLLDHHWPGNVRELFNVLERSKIRMEDGIIWEEAIEFDF